MPERIEFRNRAHEVSRLEAFSDVVFGFAISLLVISLEAPKSYGQLMEMMRGFLPFAVCFFIFIDIWWEHHDFFRRYALQDRVVNVLNTLLLFVILFYVYPLKFMFTLALSAMQGQRIGVPAGSARTLFTLYGIGVMDVFWLLALMYLHAWRRREALQLTEIERIDTLESILDNAFMGAFGLLSLLLANIGLERLAGLVYFLLCIPKTLVPWVMGTKRKKAQERIDVITRDADAVAVS
jgi:uncharacterized membrane protein